MLVPQVQSLMKWLVQVIGSVAITPMTISLWPGKLSTMNSHRVQSIVATEHQLSVRRSSA